ERYARDHEDDDPPGRGREDPRRGVVHREEGRREEVEQPACVGLEEVDEVLDPRPEGDACAVDEPAHACPPSPEAGTGTAAASSTSGVNSATMSIGVCATGSSRLEGTRSASGASRG